MNTTTTWPLLLPYGGWRVLAEGIKGQKLRYLAVYMDGLRLSPRFDFGYAVGSSDIALFPGDEDISNKLVVIDWED